MKLVYVICLLLGAQCFAVEKEGVKFPETKSVEGQELKLLGVGLRKAVRFGFSFKVYVAGLYVANSVKGADQVESDSSPKYIEMSFLRRVDKSSMNEAWTEGMYNNCIADCEHYRDQIRPVTEMMVDVLDRGHIEITFTKDAVKLHIDGRENKQAEFKDANLAKNLLRVFIGPKPADPDLKKGMLGL